MNINELKINELEWTIEEVDTRSQELVIDNNWCNGVCIYTQQRILLDKSLKNDKKIQTLRHELAHAFIYCYLLNQKESYTEEELCEFMGIYGGMINKITEEYFRAP